MTQHNEHAHYRTPTLRAGTQSFWVGSSPRVPLFFGMLLGLFALLVLSVPVASSFECTRAAQRVRCRVESFAPLSNNNAVLDLTEQNAEHLQIQGETRDLSPSEWQESAHRGVLRVPVNSTMVFDGRTVQHSGQGSAQVGTWATTDLEAAVRAVFIEHTSAHVIAYSVDRKSRSLYGAALAVAIWFGAIAVLWTFVHFFRVTVSDETSQLSIRHWPTKKSVTVHINTERESIEVRTDAKGHAQLHIERAGGPQLPLTPGVENDRPLLERAREKILCALRGERVQSDRFTIAHKLAVIAFVAAAVLQLLALGIPVAIERRIPQWGTLEVRADSVSCTLSDGRVLAQGQRFTTRERVGQHSTSISTAVATGTQVVFQIEPNRTTEVRCDDVRAAASLPNGARAHVFASPRIGIQVVAAP